MAIGRASHKRRKGPSLAVLAALGPFVGGAITLLATNFFSFHDKLFEGNAAFVSQVAEANEGIGQSLVKFSNVALGRGSFQKDDKLDFTSALNKADAKADALKSAIPSLAPLVSDYTASLVKLKQASDRLTGPLTGKSFVEAVSDYAVARDNLAAAAAKARSSYLIAHGITLPRL
ncbi:hypothetical protein D3273_13395 [Lichenibacterium minor]|uniref:Methyl-accepting chemotaxis protein n=1 Tax=Lichenibacterium minor TaxID=2316528 RepID=A0A4Q2U4A7_9HYPH|nr:hypothetical protein [Lichenibacterium minor]RYC31379.1 hypothetical protein D3273_13395 [Lichenibacterium minor]